MPLEPPTDTFTPAEIGIGLVTEEFCTETAPGSTSNLEDPKVLSDTMKTRASTELTSQLSFRLLSDGVNFTSVLSWQWHQKVCDRISAGIDVTG